MVNQLKLINGKYEWVPIANYNNQNKEERPSVGICKKHRPDLPKRGLTDMLRGSY